MKFLDRFHCVYVAEDDRYGNWSIESGKRHFLFMEDVVEYMTKDNLKKIKLKNIAWRGKHNYCYENGEISNKSLYYLNLYPRRRYEAADTDYPGIITNGPNPFDNKYIMLDGRRRLHKLLFNNKQKGLFYVLPWKKIKPLFISDPKILDKRYTSFYDV